ncbi:phosphoribosyl-ATP diphosphatase [Candidatus Pacearchaeota archaeon]|nr:phosphoribosyl-ATP diphosphatase [Candidatus Pacearchaeota archaeon]
MILFIVPKNAGLQRCREIAESLTNDISKIQEVRGEDVPLFVERCIQESKRAIGITGEDLFKEFLLTSRKTALRILRRFKWEDESFVYGKPVLCLMGSKDKSLEEMPQRAKICINSKYKEIAKKYFINPLENKGYTIEKIYASGATEGFFLRGLVDGVIDIVCSGKSAENAGLTVYEKIFESDIVLIGKPEPCERLSLDDLYNKILARIAEGSDKSYTYKLANDPPLLYRKIIEEAGEVITAKTKEDLIWEISDLLYFILVLMAKNAVSLGDIEIENTRRDRKESIKNSKGDGLL